MSRSASSKQARSTGLGDDEACMSLPERLLAFLRSTAILLLLLAPSIAAAQPADPPAAADKPAARDTSRGDKMLKEYFAAETKKLTDRCLADIKSLDDWKAKRETY